jgi:integrase
MPYVVLQAIMGHADISITLQYYVDITPEQMAAAAEMMVTNF